MVDNNSNRVVASYYEDFVKIMHVKGLSGV